MHKQSRLDALLNPQKKTMQCTPPGSKRSSPTSEDDDNQTDQQVSDPTTSAVADDTEFIKRMKGLGVYRRRSNREFDNLQSMIHDSENFSELTFRQALSDLQHAYDALEDRRHFCEEVLTEEALMSKPDYLQPIKKPTHRLPSMD